MAEPERVSFLLRMADTANEVYEPLALGCPPFCGNMVRVRWGLRSMLRVAGSSQGRGWRRCMVLLLHHLLFLLLLLLRLRVLWCHGHRGMFILSHRGLQAWGLCAGAGGWERHLVLHRALVCKKGNGARGRGCVSVKE